jgi:hypothetical protein
MIQQVQPIVSQKVNTSEANADAVNRPNMLERSNRANRTFIASSSLPRLAAQEFDAQPGQESIRIQQSRPENNPDMGC